MKIKIFTHTDLDGYGCAILAQIAAGRDNVDAEYCGYYNINEKIKSFIDSRKHSNYDYIFITDISVNENIAELINKINDIDHKFYLIDHHPTAISLNKYYWAQVLIEDEIEKVCGTSLFYKTLIEHSFIKPNKRLDIFVEKIKRYDTWLWKEKYNDLEAQALNNLFKIYGQSRFSEIYFGRLMYLNDEYFKLIDDMDKFLLDIEHEKVEQYIYKKNKSMVIETLNINNKEYKVGLVVAENYISELGNTLSEKHTELDFIAIVSALNTVSYRTVKDGIDLGADIAAYYGGGGHSKAAGSQISNEIKKKILDIVFK